MDLNNVMQIPFAYDFLHSQFLHLGAKENLQPRECLVKGTYPIHNCFIAMYYFMKIVSQGLNVTYLQYLLKKNV